MPVNCKVCKHYDSREYETEGCWLARDMFFAEGEHCCIYWEEEEDSKNVS